MTYSAEPTDMSIDRNVVGRVREDQIGAFVPEQSLKGLGVAGIPTQEPMPPELPQVSVVSASERRSGLLRAVACKRPRAAAAAGTV
jgi:hypothetical protein